VKENEYRRQNDIPDVDSYLEIRRASLAQRPYSVMLEFVLDLDLTTLLDEDPDLASTELLLAEHILLVNDLISYRNECFAGDYFNLTSSLIHRHGHNLQQAVDEIVARIAEADQKLNDAVNLLRRRYAAHPAKSQIETYLNALGPYCAGNLRWSFETPRYHGRRYGWNGLRAGMITLAPDRTVLDAEDSPLTGLASPAR
jgi:hypothetical protein